MGKAVSFLSRLVLVLGVLVALTPCGLCQRSSWNTERMTVCHGKTGMNCCHSSKSKNPSPLCQAMDQSATQASMVKALPAAEGTASARLFPPSSFQTLFFLPRVVSGAPPFRGPIVLRI